MSLLRQFSCLRFAVLLLFLVGCVPTGICAFSSIPSTLSSQRIVVNEAWNSNGRCITKHQTSTTPSSSTTTLTAIPVPQVAVVAGTRVATFYKAFPIIAGFLTASTKAAVADSMAQYHDVDTKKFDVKRNLAMVLYSGLVLGISCEIMYNRLFPILFGTAASNTASTALKMTLFDGFVNAPLLWLPPAYIAKALLYRYPKREALQKYVVDVKENGLLKKYWCLWLPMSMINFLIVPVHFRIAFVAAVSFFWMTILSLVANNNGWFDGCR